MDNQDLPRESEFPADLSPLAWVQEEVRRSIEAVHKTLRRHLRDSDTRVSGLTADLTAGNPLGAAAAQLHQVSGVLALVGLPAGTTVLRAAEATVAELAAHPMSVDPQAVELVERADFALLSYITRLLAGNQSSPLALFNAYRELQTFNGAERIHPADLWRRDWQWQVLPADASAQAQDAATLRPVFEATLLKHMRAGSREHAQELSNLCAGLAAGLDGQPHSRTLWQLAAAVFEAEARGLLNADAYVKRLGSRLLSALRSVAKGDAGLGAAGDRLAQDLLFFCAQAQLGNAPRLAVVRSAYALAEEDRGDYEDRTLGSIDPNWVAQARRRVGIVKDSWSSVAEGDQHRLAGLDEQFAGLGESLTRLFPSGEVLGETLQRAIVATLRSGKPPQAPLAMEVATSILYVEAALDDAAFDQPEQAERVKRMAARVDAVSHGEPPEPLETWMEDLYRRVSDRQTLGSVVHELRASLSEVEKQADAYFRDTTQRELLIPVPNLLQAMRGVLSVLGLTHAAQACLRMRDEFDDLANTEVDPSLPGPREIFDRLANNLGALGFMINMLSVQPALAKRMFAFDDASGRLEPVMGRHADAAPTLTLPSLEPVADLAPAPVAQPLALDLPELPDFAPVAAPIPAPIAAPFAAPAPVSSAAGDPEMLEIFLEEAGEVVETARGAIAALQTAPADHEQLTTLRRAFHTLKGSSRMVGLDAYGEGAWACEQLFNARLGASDPVADPDLLSFSGEAIEYLAHWADQIAGRAEGEFGPEPLREAADSLRLHGVLKPVAPAAAAAAEVAVPEVVEVLEIPAAPEVIEMPVVAEYIDEPTLIEMPPEVVPEPVPFEEPTLVLEMPPAAPQVPDAPATTFGATEMAAEFAPTLMEGALDAMPVEPVADVPEFRLNLDLGDEPAPTEPAVEAMSMDEFNGLRLIVTKSEPFESEAAAEPEAHAEASEEPAEDEVKVIGDLRIGIQLFNIFLNEADELSRRLATSLSEWALQPGAAVPHQAESQAHALAGNAATVGYEDLSTLARALEHALERAGRATRIAHNHVEDFVQAGEGIRALLHQFAAGFLKEADADLVERLNAYEPEIEEPVSVSAELDALPVMAEDVPSADADEPEPGLPDHIEPELFGFFEEEAHDLLNELHASLREWLARPTGDGGGGCMRVLHTFKGGARLAGAMRLGEQAHDMETDVEHLLRGDTPPHAVQLMHLQDLADGLQAGFEALCERVHAPVAAEPVVPAPVVELLAEAVAEPVAAVVPEPLPESVEPLLEPLAEAELEAMPAPEVVEAAEAIVAAEPVADAPAQSAAKIDWARFIETQPEDNAPDAGAVGLQALLRVRASLLERMAAQAGEVAIRRSRMESELAQMKSALLDLDDNLDRIRGQLRELELQAEAQMGKQQEAVAHAQDFDPLEFDRYTRFTELTRMLAESVGDVATVQRSLQRNVQLGEDELAAQSRLTRELQDDLLRTRMVEFDSLSERMHRVVRQAAREAGRQARLEVVGANTELDRSVLERMAGAFEHLLRNSVSHGIEPPDLREKAGKDPVGTLKLTVSQAGNEILLDFADDGAGLNLDRIRARGKEKGLIKDGESPDAAALMNLIFAPGFSTATQVTELSGRGVGMDVVRAEVNTLGGSIETRSTMGQGASFLLRLPLTTALTRIVLLRVGEQVVAVPAALMDSVLRLPMEQYEAARAAGEIELGGHRQPLYSLAHLLGQSEHVHAHHGKTQPLVLVRSSQHRLALVVDEVIGNQEVVVKNLGPQLNKVPGLAGISLLASGDVALIYNPVALADWYGVAALARAQGDVPGDALAAPEAVEPPEAPLVLVVDDSLTVRRATQRLLEREGYRVLLAKDGLDAMEKLAADELPALVLSDIEMPRMDGFDLVRNMRADSRLAPLPVIMITSRIAQKHRDYAGQLGVDHYLGKPYDEEQLLGLIARYTGAHQAA
ncbi:Hpt domain-containing protein [Burkholderiaceae bacterium UC74_6]